MPVFIASPPESSFCPCSQDFLMKFFLLKFLLQCGNHLPYTVFSPAAHRPAVRLQVLSLLHRPTSFRQDLYTNTKQQEGDTHPASQSFLAFRVLIKWGKGECGGRIDLFQQEPWVLVCFCHQLCCLCTSGAQFSIYQMSQEGSVIYHSISALPM